MAKRDYRLISADSHLSLPPGFFQRYLPQRYRDHDWVRMVEAGTKQSLKMAGMGLGHMVCIQPFRRLCFDADGAGFHIQKLGHMLPEFAGNRRDLGCCQHQGRVNIHDAVAGILDFFQSKIQKDGRISPFPSRVARGEKTADVAG